MSSHVQVMQNDAFDHAFMPAPAVAPKPEIIGELLCHLPTAGAHVTGEPDHLPISVHTDVLDSVFSANLDAEDGHAFNGTPMFDDLDFMVDGTKANSKEDWVSLFKDDDPVDAKFAGRDEPLDDLVGDDFKESFDFVPVVPQVKQLETPATPMLGTPVMDDFTPSVQGTKRKSVDHLGCVSYIKKQRTQPLKPIAAENGDPIAMKRARNTEAARRSRARKMERMSQLEEKVEDLMQDKTHLQDEVARLREILTAHNIMF
ncbi:hypothetical protein METBIDRAFT_42927 [Metschnikowia bicuspidata var. bicuspidata NRRL YB-4993]|uniref:BZIP domain-containing protein n=1 Tax=Metschnikowia bicuspidata var. bicuspidata NRRL YB-4993 TaxID=869754 RepID=A0A1A0H8Y3_9ASCO|nr:hypothetical protein METBIDRAFT_42927 [Metschnikowia bicuspidata var. bicuspidata NRRL YB-4993]OBA20460.1 hypothetical protein METBIDRAFT_42927 [Metschnikowia bicuspidata var. bicuspidata NRRL YB-4993]